MKILHLDSNHPLLLQGLQELGHTNIEDYSSPKEKVLSFVQEYDGIVIRSRFKIDVAFLDKAKNLKFIARVGAGLENIDCEYAASKGIQLFSAPEGNRNAVGEHTLGMLLCLLNKITLANAEVKKGKWLREANRGIELDGKTVGLIGYGNMGKAFAKKLGGFDVEVICYDIKENVGDENATQVPLEELQAKADVLSLHTPETPLTTNFVDSEFISNFNKPFWLINTARGKNVNTEDVVSALKSGKILGAGLDVLEYEKSSFENLFKAEIQAEPSSRAESRDNLPDAFQYLVEAENVILTPHVAGWTVESHRKLAQTIVDKIKEEYG